MQQKLRYQCCSAVEVCGAMECDGTVCRVWCVVKACNWWVQTARPPDSLDDDAKVRDNNAPAVKLP